MTELPRQEDKVDSEAKVGRNPHPDFTKVEASRPDWDESSEFHFTKTRRPGWNIGDGANDNGESLTKEQVPIDPYESGRPSVSNYKLLISAIIPRPIGFVSTISKDGKSTNLAPFSYFQVVCHDPPLFVLGFSGGFDMAKDTLRNLSDTSECTINIISEHFIEAANATAIDAPHGTSEWSLTGLTPAPSSFVQPSRVKEAIFSVEGKLASTQEFESKATKGKKTGVLAVVEGLRFWVREDAVNEERNLVDPAVLKPMSRLGGITYARCAEGLEIPRPKWDEKKEEADEKGLVKEHAGDL